MFCLDNTVFKSFLSNCLCATILWCVSHWYYLPYSYEIHLWHCVCHCVKHLGSWKSSRWNLSSSKKKKTMWTSKTTNVWVLISTVLLAGSVACFKQPWVHYHHLFIVLHNHSQAGILQSRADRRGKLGAVLGVVCLSAFRTGILCCLKICR